MTTPLSQLVHYPTNTDADLDRLQQLCEQLAGFDEHVSLEWLDGAMTALAAGPRALTVADWRGHWGRQPNAHIGVEVDPVAFFDRFIDRVGAFASKL